MAHKIGIIKSINVNLTISAVLFLLGVGHICIFIFYPAFREELKFIAAIIGGITGIYSAFYIGKSLRLQLKLNMVSHSISFLDDLFSLEACQMRVKLEEKFDHNKILPKDMYEQIISDPEVHTAVRFLLNRFEDISIAIQKGFADERTLALALGYLVPFWAKTYYPYIDEERKRRQSKLLFCEAEKLANSWTAEKYLTSSKKIDFEEVCDLDVAE